MTLLIRHANGAMMFPWKYRCPSSSGISQPRPPCFFKNTRVGSLGKKSQRWIHGCSHEIKLIAPKKICACANPVPLGLGSSLAKSSRSWNVQAFLVGFLAENWLQLTSRLHKAAVKIDWNGGPSPWSHWGGPITELPNVDWRVCHIRWKGSLRFLLVLDLCTKPLLLVEASSLDSTPLFAVKWRSCFWNAYIGWLDPLYLWCDKMRCKKRLLHYHYLHLFIVESLFSGESQLWKATFFSCWSQNLNDD